MNDGTKLGRWQRCVWRTAFGIGCLCIALTGSRAAQPTVDEHTIIKSAFAFFKVGDTASGLATLTKGVKQGPSAPSEDYQLGRQLGTISCLLKNEGNGARAMEVAALSIARLAESSSRGPAKQRAVALTLTGDLYEQVLNDSARARQAYEQALGADSSSKLLTQKIAHLDATEKRAEEKTVANDKLRANKSLKP